LLTAKGQIIVATAADTPTALPVGSNGQVLLACTACTEGVFWSQPFIRCDEFTAKGQILGATGAGTFTALAPAAADCYWLLSCAACPNGMAWANTPSTLGDTPVGAVGFFAGVTAPNGWLVADGSAVSRTAYAALFAQIGTIYGAGDGSSTFNLPDLRGMFPRGWDAAGGTARGCDPGRAFGSTQDDMVGPHTHKLCFQSFGPTNGNGNYFAGQQGTSSIYTCACANRESACAVQTSTGTETRPLNVAMLPCIKWLVTTAPPGSSTCGIPCQCLTAKGGLVTATAADTPSALPVGTNGQFLVANSACATGLQWGSALPTGCSTGQVVVVNTACPGGIQSTNAGKVVSAVAGPGVAIAMDNLQIRMAPSGCRSIQIATVSGSALARIQSAFCQDGGVGAQNSNLNINTSFANINGWNFTSANAVQNANIMIGSPATAAYCVSMQVGAGYTDNILCITRIV
jgi:microcystin-dependent protein